MKSKVIESIDYQALNLPHELFHIEVPSWQAVTQPLKDYALKQYTESSGKVAKELTDEILAAMPDLPMNTIEELETVGIQVYQKEQSDYYYYQVLFPAILSAYKNQAVVEIDPDEFADYKAGYLKKIKDYANEYELSLEDYGRKIMRFTGDVMATFEERALEDFTFKVIADDYYHQIDGKKDEQAYETFIQQNVLHQQADEIELRQKIPYELFVEMIPELHLSQEIYQFYFPKIRFVINPEASLQFYQ